MSYTKTQKLTETGEYLFCYPPAKFRQGTARSPTENYPSIQLFGHCCDFVWMELRQKSKKINTRKFLAQLYPVIALSELNPSLRLWFYSDSVESGWKKMSKNLLWPQHLKIDLVCTSKYLSFENVVKKGLYNKFVGKYFKTLFIWSHFLVKYICNVWSDGFRLSTFQFRYFLCPVAWKKYF